MRSISSLTYTNVSLTVLILLVLALIVKPFLPVTSAYASDRLDLDPDAGRNDAQSRKAAALNPNADNAAAVREVADAIHEVATAIRESAKAQAGIASAFGKLSQDTAK